MKYPRQTFGPYETPVPVRRYIVVSGHNRVDPENSNWGDCTTVGLAHRQAATIFRDVDLAHGSNHRRIMMDAVSPPNYTYDNSEGSFTIHDFGIALDVFPVFDEACEKFIAWLEDQKGHGGFPFYRWAYLEIGVRSGDNATRILASSDN